MFDPIINGKLNRHIKECGSSSGGETVLPDKTINLADYGDGTTTVNDAILGLALGGGGTVTFNSGMEQLWADVVAKQPDYLLFDVGSVTEIRMSITVLFASEPTVLSGDAVISASGLLSLYGMSLMGYFVLASAGSGSGLTISVKAEPIEFATAEA